MSASLGPDIVKDGLVFCFDPGDSKSYSPNMFSNPTDIFAWCGSAGATNATISRDVSISSPAGSTPLKLTPSGNDSYINTVNTSQWNITPAFNGETWTVSVYVKAAAATTCQIFIFGANSSGIGFVGGSWLAITAQTHNVTTEWTRISTSITMNNSNIAFLQLRLDGPDTFVSSIPIWFDGLQVEKNSSPTDFNPNYYGSTIKDISQNRLNLTINSSPTYSSSNNGFLTFDGADDYANINSFSGSIPTGSSPRTLCAFIRPTSVSGGREIFGIGGNTVAGSRSALWIDSSNAIGIEFLGSSVLTTSWPGINNWLYLCASIPSTNVHSSLIYVNGSLVSSTASGSNVTLNSLSTSCAIATVPGAPGAHPFQGSIGSIHLYNRTLSASEINKNFYSLRIRFGV